MLLSDKDILNRREFLQTTGAAVLERPLAAVANHLKTDDLKQVRITKITGFRHTCRRPKLIGKNSHVDNHGWQTSENVLRIGTNHTIEGIGVGTTTPEVAHQLIGHSLEEYWKPGLGIVSPLGRADHALFDLVGKALRAPAWQLLGGRGPAWVPVYDGSFYFADLLPEYQNKPVARLLEEVEASLKSGHRAFKVKVGRGYKWMDKEAGFKRDVEVVQAIRKLIGKNRKLMVDANNGFDLESTKRWLDALGDDLFWLEEMFPEQVDQDSNLKLYLRKKGWHTLIADGESARDNNHFGSFIETESLDVVQPDIRAFGYTKLWELSRRLEAKPRMKLATHNWGSFLGLHMQLVLARGIPNFLIAEQDPSASDLFDTSNFTFKEGAILVPEAPGCGLVLREAVFKEKYRSTAWVVTS